MFFQSLSQIRTTFLNSFSMVIKLNKIISLLTNQVIPLLKSLIAASNNTTGAINISLDIINENGDIKENMDPVILKDDEQVTAFLNIKDIKGQPAQVEKGSIVWAAPNFVEVVPAEDGLSANIKALSLGANAISVSADADLGDGVVTISRQFDVSVIASQAAVIDITVGEITKQ